MCHNNIIFLFQRAEQFHSEINAPKNDLAVLCHGDFNRNNILFKYNSVGEVIASKFIDFQMARYAQPSIDLSFVLALNVSIEDLHKHFDRFFDIYHTAVHETIKNNAPGADLSKYSRLNFIKDYATHAFHGFKIISFFLPAVDKPTGMTCEEFVENCAKADSMEAYLDGIPYGTPHVMEQMGSLAKHAIDLYQKYSDYRYF